MGFLPYADGASKRVFNYRRSEVGVEEQIERKEKKQPLNNGADSCHGVDCFVIFSHPGEGMRGLGCGESILNQCPIRARTVMHLMQDILMVPHWWVLGWWRASRGDPTERMAAGIFSRQERTGAARFTSRRWRWLWPEIALHATISASATCTNYLSSQGGRARVCGQHAFPARCINCFIPCVPATLRPLCKVGTGRKVLGLMGCTIARGGRKANCSCCY